MENLIIMLSLAVVALVFAIAFFTQFEKKKELKVIAENSRTEVAVMKSQIIAYQKKIDLLVADKKSMADSIYKLQKEVELLNKERQKIGLYRDSEGKIRKIKDSVPVGA